MGSLQHTLSTKFDLTSCHWVFCSCRRKHIPQSVCKHSTIKLRCATYKLPPPSMMPTTQFGWINNRSYHRVQLWLWGQVQPCTIFIAWACPHSLQEFPVHRPNYLRRDSMSACFYPTNDICMPGLHRNRQVVKGHPFQLRHQLHSLPSGFGFGGAANDTFDFNQVPKSTPSCRNLLKVCGHWNWFWCLASTICIYRPNCFHGRPIPSCGWLHTW